MEDDFNPAQRYRERAKKLRALAKDETDSKTRATLMRIAEEYERLYSRALSKFGKIQS